MPSRAFRRALLPLAAAVLLLGACSPEGSSAPSPGNDSPGSTSPVDHPPGGDRHARQTGSITALNQGDLGGRVPVGELRGWGDLGLGTYDGLDGEMVVVDGVVWQIGVDGMPRRAADDLTSPFAQITAFEPTDQLEVAATSCAEVGAAIDAVAPADAELVALRITGNLAAVTLRSVPRQAAPYPPLATALTEQVTFDLGPLEGTLVGFRTGAALASSSPEGYHLHFLSDDARHGGHVLSCELTAVTVELAAVDQLDLVLR